MRKKLSGPLLIFLGVLLVLGGFHVFSSFEPRISSIEPKVGAPGTTLTIKGWGFGKEKSPIIMGDVYVPASMIEEWSPNRIRVRIPDHTPSGLVYVFNKNGRSNPVLFTNTTDIPVLAEETRELSFPQISSIEPAKGAVGDIITIYGRNFGISRGNGVVYFSWAGLASSSTSTEKIGQYLAASNVDLDYEGWSDTEIRVRVPSGAGSGNLFVLSEKGKSNTVFFEVDSSAGGPVFKEKRTYTVRSSLSIENVMGGEDGGLYLWIPRVQEGPNQRDVQLTTQEPKAEIENYNGLMLVLLRNLNPNQRYTVSQSFLLDRYETEFRVNIQKLKPDYEKARPSYQLYTAANSVTPVEDPEIVKIVQLVVGNEKNPYAKARRIYSYLLQKLQYVPSQNYRSVVEGLREGRGDAYTFALLFVAMARNTGIPARTLAGYLVTEGKQALPHFWCEFYLEQVGWIEVDPTLGTSPPIDGFRYPSDPKNYYFGNIDNRRITFSRGLAQAKRITPHGRTIEQPEIHSLQNIYAEVVGGIRNYSGKWNNLEIIGVY
ncbi:MAG: transglutaminase domain-containing protein [Spirochaetales bacterium]